MILLDSLWVFNDDQSSVYEKSFIDWFWYILLFIGLVFVIMAIVFIVKSIIRHSKKYIWLIITMISLGISFIIIGFSNNIQLANVGLYGCPNSKRIGKLNIKKRKVKDGK